MDEYESSKKTLQYRIVARQFEFALEASKRLPAEDQELLLKEVARLIVQQIPIAASEENVPINASKENVPVASSDKRGAVTVLGVEIKSS